jgi:cbb3-type cytochrome oxidase cytochrome c subunit
MNLLPLRVCLLIASIYGYFLIFAQFAFVELIRAGGANATSEKMILAAMAVGGISAGFFIAWRGLSSQSLRASLLVSAALAGLAPLLNSIPSALLIGFFSGAMLGIATVCLATLLRGWCGIFWIGLGTGIAYAFCNVPLVFEASPSQQAWIAAGLASLGALLVPKEGEPLPIITMAPSTSRDLAFGVLIFTALVWLDSAAFFIIQHESEMKAGTWGSGHLWRNATLHFLAALLTGYWMRSGSARALPLVAWTLLALACFAVNDPSTRSISGWLYPLGVSVYSVALVAWPGFLSGANDRRQIAWRAALLFGIAGWFGSANGIGMAQSLKTIPSWFIIVAGLAVLIGMKNWRTALVIGFLFCAFQLGNSNRKTPSEIARERGKQVYLAEGCIHCHSQYTRPGTLDAALWGEANDPAASLLHKPVLIGNRRQGPDLANIGLRRSSTWLKLHFIAPQAFAPSSPMPSYAHLFKDRRGDDLIAYLKSLGAGNEGDHFRHTTSWRLSDSQHNEDGELLYARHCRVCHGDEGRANGAKAALLTRTPANLADGPFAWTAGDADLPDRLARIIKFGISGTDMPGHETLKDGEISALRDYLLKIRLPSHSVRAGQQ